MLFWKYLDYVYSLGRNTATRSLIVAKEIMYSTDKLRSKNSVSWDIETCLYGIITTLVALLMLALPRIVGTTIIFHYKKMGFS